MSSVEYLRGEKVVDPCRKRHGLTSVIGRSSFKSKLVGRHRLVIEGEKLRAMHDG